MNIKWFTLVELIVSISILAIISTIWFISYSSYLWDSRDSQRKSDLAQLSSALKVYKQKRWYYPNSWDFFNITFRWYTVAEQWLFNQNVRLNTLDRLPMDPKTKQPYVFSVTRNKQEFEIAATLENEDNSMAIVSWDYKSASIWTLPGITLAIERRPWESAEIVAWETNAWWNWTDNRNRFIFEWQSHNLPYDFDTLRPKSDWTPLQTILDDLIAKNIYWQNTDFRTCTEIKDSWKAIQNNSESIVYQTISNSWALENTNCVFP